ncbi:hypothetical protein SLS56_010773 [Neofusicoccum ribis]|uniref:Pectate lyase n=1 Tax=Neofusicoccum ribis TaxID=45134 RepID=A0ABR3SF20_9PEZI
MKFTYAALAAGLASLASAQSLAIPARVGAVNTINKPIEIDGPRDFGNAEYTRGMKCVPNPKDTGSNNAVFVLKPGAAISNVIIGADSWEGIHCLGSCTITNVWFRDVCEDAISALGPGKVTINGGGAQDAQDKIIQANGKGLTVEVNRFTALRSGKLIRSCGDCTGNGGPRNFILNNVRAYGMTSALVGINSNYGDSATITNTCGSGKKVCQDYLGVEKGKGKSDEVATTHKCLGPQGKLTSIPAC